MVAGDTDRVKIAYLVGGKVFLDITHYLQAEFGGENTGVLTLVLFENVCLNRTTYALQGLRGDLLVFLLVGIPALIGGKALQLLIDCGIQVHGQDGRRWTVNSHGHRGGRLA